MACYVKIVDFINEPDGKKTPVFLCDPERYTACEKTMCGTCTATTKREYAKRVDAKEGNFILAGN